MRLFVSLRPPADVRAHLAAAAGGLRTTRVDQWHLTLAVLGEVADPGPLVPPLARAAASSPPLVLRLQGGGFFRGPGVLHAAVAGDVDGLHRLASVVRDACAETGVDLERRPFLPHVTVARRLPTDPGVLAGYTGPTWTAGQVELVRSRLGPRVEHEVVERFPLGPG